MEVNDPQRPEALDGIDPKAAIPPARLDASACMDEAIAAIARRYLRRLIAHESGLLAGINGEDLHEMRVLLRRLRELIALKGQTGGKKDGKRLKKHLQRLGRVLGSVRDLDVLIERTESYAARRSRTDLTAFIGALRSERDARREKTQKYLASDEYSRLKESLELFVDKLKKCGESNPDWDNAAVDPSSVATIFPAALLTRYGRLRAYEGRLEVAGALDVKRCHRLRMEEKRLLYLIDFFQDYLGPECKPLTGRLKRLHDLLGRLQDAQSACTLIGRYLEEGNFGGKTSKAKYEALATQSSIIKYLAAAQSDLRTCLKRLPAVWQPVAGRWFAARLAYLVGRL